MTIPLVELPDSACAASVIMSLDTVVARTASPYTKSEQAFLWPGEAWSMEFDLPPIKDKRIAGQFKAFGVKLKGSYNRFLAGDPSAPAPVGVATGTPQVNGAEQTGSFLATKGWTPNIQGILLQGDYIQIGEDDSAQLLMVLEDADSDAMGEVILSVGPSIRTAPPDDSTIVVNNPRGVFRMIANTWSWRVAPGGIYSLSFRAVEAIDA